MKTIILCAGFATRMYPLTENQPKALLSVGGIPILSRIINRFVADGVDLGEIFITTNAKFFKHFRDWHERSNYEIKIDIINDGSTDNSNRLGAIGDLKLVIDSKKIADDIVVVAGDNLIAFDTLDFINFARERRLAVACKDLKNKDKLSLYGVMQLDQNSKIITFEEKPQHPKSSLISTGVYYFGKEYLSAVDDFVKSATNTDKSGELISWLVNKYPVYGYKLKGQWFDIGDMETYREVCEMFGGEENQ